MTIAVLPLWRMAWHPTGAALDDTGVTLVGPGRRRIPRWDDLVEVGRSQSQL